MANRTFIERSQQIARDAEHHAKILRETLPALLRIKSRKNNGLLDQTVFLVGDGAKVFDVHVGPFLPPGNIQLTKGNIGQPGSLDEIICLTQPPHTGEMEILCIAFEELAADILLKPKV